ncbi:extracellular solute-binding protein [Arthrobacter sp. OV608]|uniref:ABC transporter substrate-binding protein n=1 Tax=Arthrobacter sp. OV608 TaxID=1882768 RepID=UPI001481B4AC|nr:extracellular solute-binding protein [Arthrobacter sp. OV608]
MDQAEWSKIEDAANKEGEVTVYGVVNAKTVDAITSGFAKDYPNIKLTYVRLSPSDIRARLDAEIASGNAGADAVDNLDHASFDGYAAKGALLPLTVPSLGDPEFDRTKYERTPYVAQFVDGPYAWAWNTKLLPQGISSWQDYLNLDVSQLAATDPSIGPSVAAMYETFEGSDAGGSGFLDKLTAKGKPRIYAGSNPQVAALAAGEVAASLPVPVAVAATIKATGAPIDYRLPPTTQSITSELAVVKSAKHLNAAQVFANWLLGKAGQGAVAQGGFVAVRGGTPQTIDTKGATLVELPQITTDQFKAFLQRWNQLLAQ